MNKINFTLVELLMVIAIIAIISSMLLPSLNHSMEVARRIPCLNNLKQCGILTAVYTDTYKGLLMDGDYSIAVGYTAWHKQLVSLDANNISKNILWCPKDLANLNKDSQYAYNAGDISFGFNRRHMRGARLSRIKNPSQKLIFVENAKNIHSGMYEGFYHVESGISSVNPMAYPRHESFCNVMFIDGHVESIQAPGNSWPNLYIFVFGQSWDTNGTGTMWNKY